jgi:putative transposase
LPFDGHPENIKFEGKPMWRSYLSGARTAVEAATAHPRYPTARRGRGPAGAPPLARGQPEREKHGKRRPSGYDAGKKIKGRKRHILTDTEGNLVHAVVHTADIQDRDGAPLGWPKIIRRFPWLRHVFADGGYAGAKLRTRCARSANGQSRSSNGQMPQGLRRSPAPLGCRAHPHGSTEPTSRQGFEQIIASATAWLFIASIRLTRRIARS